MLARVTVALCALLGAIAVPSEAQIVSGSLTEWQPVTLDFAGPSASELGATNPFLNWRLNVTFTNTSTGKSYVAPGYFDGDGNGGGTGNLWRTRFTPDEPGQWTYTASFRSGTNVAVDLSPTAGTADGLIDGKGGTFVVGDRDPCAPGFFKWGRLEYDATGTAASKHYLKFRDGGYWIKGGADSPENLLAFRDFDNTPNWNHQYYFHLGDWHDGDPTWTGGNGGRGLLGAFNYLSSQHVNSVYFLPMNIGGDGKDTWPFAGSVDRFGAASNDNIHYDISKLRQWDIVFQHAQKQGILLHFVLNEAETANKMELDNGELGVERKLFYREMIARFGYSNALQWNISEEYNLNFNLGETRVKQFAQYIQDVDPYDHPITVHNAGTPSVALEPFIGDIRFSLTSIQDAGADGLGSQVEYFRQRSETKGRPIPVMIDEPESLHLVTRDEVRKRMLWDIYLSGGGVEWIDASKDKSLENFRDYEPIWQDTWYARKFMEDNLPFWEMNPADSLLTGESSTYGGGEVFAKTGQVYAIYLPQATSTGSLDLRGLTGGFLLRWYNPRTGEFEGPETILAGGQLAALGAVPSGASEDWAALITAEVPEPTTLALMALAWTALAARRRRGR